jgi:hypothetical protein
VQTEPQLMAPSLDVTVPVAWPAREIVNANVGVYVNVTDGTPLASAATDVLLVPAPKPLDPPPPPPPLP